MSEGAAPLRLSAERVRLYGAGLFLLGLAMLPATMRYVSTLGKPSDWADFRAAGAMVGTRALLDPAAHSAWSIAHHADAAPFVYVPGTAWFLLPAAHLSLAWGFALNAVVMLLAAIAAGALAARIYALPLRFATLAVLAWAPTTAAIVVGQNAPLGLLFTMTAIFGIVCDRAVIAGLAVGALLYKPTYALPFLLLLAVRRKWLALAIAAFCALIWYALSAAATAGDMLWPVAYAHALAGYFNPDFALNADKALSLPAMLLRLGTPHAYALAAGGVLLAVCALLFARVGLLEGASMAGAAGLAASPHALPYDAVLVLPAIFLALKTISEPWRTRLVVAVYVAAPFWMLSSLLHFDVLAVVVIGAAVAWLTARAFYTGKLGTHNA